MPPALLLWKHKIAGVCPIPVQSLIKIFSKLHENKGLVAAIVQNYR